MFILDMLDEFSATKTESKPATTEAPKPEKPTGETASDEMADLNSMSEEDFAKHLQADMANLLGGMNSNVRAGIRLSMASLTVGSQSLQPNLRR